MAYTKLFNSIVTSTIWTEDDKTRIVWITMLALADKNGEVQGSIPGLARIAGVDVDACRYAMGRFLSPDPDSRTKDDEGRRVEEIDGGWYLLNHRKYREMASDADRREQAAIRQQRVRDKKSRNSHDAVTQESLQKSQAEADTDTEAKRIPPNPQGGMQADEFALEIPESPTNEYDWMPTGWRKMAKEDRNLTRVIRNTPEMIQIGGWFQRRPETLWTVSEASKLIKINPTIPEINGMGNYYTATIPTDDHRRHDLGTLLNNWSGELDRARKFATRNNQ